MRCHWCGRVITGRGRVVAKDKDGNPYHFKCRTIAARREKNKGGKDAGIR